ncbi:uncharacterized protein ISCGN_013276 [Ixodes scapularis]
MTHILIKWVGEDKWDVYPVKALDNPAIGVQLMSEEGAIKKLRRQVVDVRWKVDEDPSPATLLDFGSEGAMEGKRTQMAKGAPDAGASTAKCSCEAKIKVLEEENELLRERLRVAETNCDSAKMAKKLERSLRHLNRLWARNEEVLESPKVDIGYGVLVEQTALAGLKSAGVSASKYVRGLLKVVFSEEELKGKSLRGRKCNAQKESEVKPALDPVKLQAVLDYTCKEYKGVALLTLTTSLSTLLCRDMK